MEIPAACTLGEPPPYPSEETLRTFVSLDARRTSYPETGEYRGEHCGIRPRMQARVVAHLRRSTANADNCRLFVNGCKVQGRGNTVRVFDEPERPHTRVTGSHCKVWGTGVRVVGSHNTVYGDRVCVEGDNNTVFGVGATVLGNNNRVYTEDGSVSGRGNMEGSLRQYLHDQEAAREARNAAAAEERLAAALNGIVDGGAPRKRQRTLVYKPRPHPDDVELPADGPEPEGGFCRICFSRRATCKLVPCDHFGLCTHCAGDLDVEGTPSFQKCPQCREPILCIVDVTRFHPM